MIFSQRKWRAKAIRTSYWRPGENRLKKLHQALVGKIRDNDIIVISEKALSTSKNLLVDEDKIKPGIFAHLIVLLWMRIFWGYILATLCHMKTESKYRLKHYPIKEGQKHKHLALTRFGLLQALRHGSEAGIDVSNLPYSYASLPIRNPKFEAEVIGKYLNKSTGKKISVLITDTDMTYTFRNIYLSPRSTSFPKILNGGGFLTYFFCRLIKLRARATPLALWGEFLNVEEALNLAEMAHHIRGSGAGKTAWDSSERFRVGLTSITWEMLESIDHYPLVLFRNTNSK